MQYQVYYNTISDNYCLVSRDHKHYDWISKEKHAQLKYENDSLNECIQWLTNNSISKYVNFS